MKNSQNILLLIIPLLACFFVYLIMAVCYGFNPYHWSDGSKTAFVCLELLVPSTAFIICVSVLTNINHENH